MPAPRPLDPTTQVQTHRHGVAADEKGAARPLWRIVRSAARLPLAAGVAAFVRLGSQWLYDPASVSVLAESGVRLESHAAVTHMPGTGAELVLLALCAAGLVLETMRGRRETSADARAPADAEGAR
jgi:hypothetical protein